MKIKPTTQKQRVPSRIPHSAFRNPNSAFLAAFTLLELLVVIGIISLLLVAVIPAVNSLSKSSGRKGAISNLLGAIEQARIQAVKDGQATYVVFPTLSAGTSQSIVDQYHYRSYAVFEDDPANPTQPKQLTPWKKLPTGISLRSQISAAPWTTASFPFAPIGTAQTFPYLKFNSAGEVESPVPATGPVLLSIFEGHVNGTSETLSTKIIITETISIARLTGRAERS